MELVRGFIALAGVKPLGCSICCVSIEGVNLTATETASTKAMATKERITVFFSRSDQ